MSRYNIDGRLGTLGKKHKDVILELRNRGFAANPGNFSRYKEGFVTTKTADAMVEAADKIISEWEGKR